LAILAFTIKTSSSHEEGCDKWLINTKEFISNDKGELVGLKTVEVAWKMTPGQRPISRKEGSEKTALALLALGFTGPEKLRSTRFRT
jgi:glutamate synthase (NADPH/NADH) small chain